MKPGVFREEYIAIIVRELLKGLEYLHQEGKLHRDIKGKSCITCATPPLIFSTKPLISCSPQMVTSNWLILVSLDNCLGHYLQKRTRSLERRTGCRPRSSNRVGMITRPTSGAWGSRQSSSPKGSLHMPSCTQ